MQIQPSRAPCKTKKSVQNKERNNFLALEKVFPVFPSPQGCSNHGAKVEFNETLKKIADAMGTGRPKTERVENLKKPPKGFVLKREFSDASRDVYIPKQSGTPVEEEDPAAAFIRKKMKENPGDVCSWLAQEYVPFLSVGEVRFMCVGGIPIRENVTGRHPDDHPDVPGEIWNYPNNDTLRTLSDLQ